jgi:hypothetical protein
MSQCTPRGALALNMSRRITLLAMLDKLTPEELERRCHQTRADLEVAANGEPISYWDFHSVVDAIEAWETGTL